MSKKSLTTPLDDNELEQLDELLLEYSPEEDDDAIISVSGLDGFFTALLSGPGALGSEDCLALLWAGFEPEFDSEREMERCARLLMRHANSIVHNLQADPDDLPLIMDSHHHDDENIVVAEDWCFGYMRAVKQANWPTLSGEAKAALDKITLHGSEANFATLSKMSLQQHQQSVMEIGDAVAALYRYWQAQR